jgi:hypothetical protein
MYNLQWNKRCHRAAIITHHHHHIGIGMRITHEFQTFIFDTIQHRINRFMDTIHIAKSYWCTCKYSIRIFDFIVPTDCSSARPPPWWGHNKNSTFEKQNSKQRLRSTIAIYLQSYIHIYIVKLWSTTSCTII